MAVFVTGGSGFVGSDLTRVLVQRGMTVRALARSSRAADRVAALGAEPVTASLFDPDGLRTAMTGCDVVFHVAGVNAMCPADPGTMYAVNVNGARAVVAAAAGAHVGRVVLTSSAAAIGEPRGSVGNESTVHSGRYLSHYARSKHLGELAFFEEARRRGVAGVAVNPSSVQGPGRVAGSARIFLYALRARRPIVLDTMLSIVDVDDVSRGHILAAERGAPGRRYLLNGATSSVREAIGQLARASGERIRPLLLPSGAAGVAGRFALLAGAGTNGRTLCAEMVRTLAHGHRFDGQRAVRELGLTYTPVIATMRRTIEWYREQGLLER